jgi:hypothetical protein
MLAVKTLEQQVDNLHASKCKEYRRLIEHFAVGSQQTGRPNLDQAIKRIETELLCQNKVLLKRALPEDLVQLNKILDQAHLPDTMGIVQFKNLTVDTEKEKLRLELDRTVQSNSLLNKELTRMGTEIHALIDQNIQLRNSAVTMPVSSDTDKSLLSSPNDSLNSSIMISQVSDLPSGKFGQTSDTNPFASNFVSQSHVDHTGIAHLLGTYQRLFQTLVSPGSTSSIIQETLAKYKKEASLHGSSMEYAQSLVETAKKELAASVKREESEKRVALQRYSAETGSNLDDGKLKISEKKNEFEKTIVFDISVNRKQAVALVQKKNSQKEWTSRLFTEEYINEDDSNLLTATLNDYEQGSKQQHKALMTIISQEVNKDKSFIKQLCSIANESTALTSQAERDSMLSSDEIIQSRFMQNDHIDDDYSFNVTQFLNASCVGNPDAKLQEQVEELLEKKKEMEMMIEDLKRREDELLKRFTKENFIKEYETRINELKHENERLKLQLEKSQFKPIEKIPKKMSESRSTASLEIESDAHAAKVGGIVSQQYYNDFTNRYTLNTKLNWSNKSIYCMKYGEEVSIQHKKGMYFAISLKTESSWGYNFFINYSNEIFGSIRFAPNFKNISESKVLDIYYSDNYSAVVTMGQWRSQPNIFCMYPGRKIYINIKNIPRLTYYMNDTGSIEGQISSGIVFGNSDRDFFFLNTENAIIRARQLSHTFNKNTNFNEQPFVRLSSSKQIIQMMTMHNDVIYLALFDGSVLAFDSKSGRQLNLFNQNTDKITALHVSCNTVVIGTVGVNKYGESVVSVCAMRADNFSDFSKYLHASVTSHIKDAEVIKTTIQGKERTVIVAVPHGKGGMLCFFDYSDKIMKHITDKENWWPRRQINGLCKVGNKLIIFGENLENDDTHADLKTVASLSFT